MPKIAIIGNGKYIPKDFIYNDELVESYNNYVDYYNNLNKFEIDTNSKIKLLKSSKSFIEKASGIKKRHIVEKKGILDIHNMCPNIPIKPSDELSLQAEMGIKAAERAICDSGIDISNIDMIIFCAAVIERYYPAIALEIQNYFNIKCLAYDLSAGCSSVIFAIKNAMYCIKSDEASCVLIVSSEIPSGVVDWKDRSSHFIFGDAAVSLVLSNEKYFNKDYFLIKSCKLFTKYSSNIRNDFGFLNRCDRNINSKEKLFYQYGKKVFKEIIPLVYDFIKNFLKENNTEINNIKKFWLHQANIRINNLIAKKLLNSKQIDDKFPITLDNFGNTAATGAILAFILNSDEMKTKDLGIICAFGAGYSIGCVLIEKDNI